MFKKDFNVKKLYAKKTKNKLKQFKKILKNFLDCLINLIKN